MDALRGARPASSVSAHLHGDLVVREREELLTEPVPVLLRPLLCQESDDLLAPLKERVAVAPDRIRL